MKKVTYETGLWSERDGSKLTWGRNNKSESIDFCAAAEVTELSADHIKAWGKAIETSGHTPADFIVVKPYTARPIAKILTPEITKCIAHAKADANAIAAKEKAELKADIAAGIALRTAEIRAYGAGASLQWASKSQDAKHMFLRYSADTEMKVEETAIKAVIGNRKCDASFPGTTNQAWIITAAEWDMIIEKTEKIRQQSKIDKEKREAADAADLQKKIDTGYCFSCGTWCHGDCGNYSNNPGKEAKRVLNAMIKQEKMDTKRN